MSNKNSMNKNQIQRSEDLKVENSYSKKNSLQSSNHDNTNNNNGSVGNKQFARTSTGVKEHPKQKNWGSAMQNASNPNNDDEYQ